MNKYLNKLNNKELEKHVYGLKTKAAKDMVKLQPGSYQRRFAELLVKTRSGITEPEIYLDQHKLPVDDPAVILQITKGFDLYVKNTFVINALEKEIVSVNETIKTKQQIIFTKQTIDEKYASKRNLFQRLFKVFRSSSDKANSVELERNKKLLKNEQKYSNLLIKTHHCINAEKDKFERDNAVKLEKVNQRAEEL
jgi:hypothetical protein